MVRCSKTEQIKPPLVMKEGNLSSKDKAYDQIQTDDILFSN